MESSSSVRRVSFGLALALFSLVVLAPVPAYADKPECPELPCSVNRNCSSTGIACRADDRSCTNDARAKDLEVKCEQQCSDGVRFVYCPLDTGRSDSRIVWLLLSLAVLLAISGSTVLWFVLRKRKA